MSIIKSYKGNIDLSHTQIQAVLSEASAINPQQHKVLFQRGGSTEKVHMLGPCANWLLPSWCNCGASINIFSVTQGVKKKVPLSSQDKEMEQILFWILQQMLLVNVEAQSSIMAKNIDSAVRDSGLDLCSAA